MVCQWPCTYPNFQIFCDLFLAFGSISPQSLIGVSITKQISDFGVEACYV